MNKRMKKNSDKEKPVQWFLYPPRSSAHVKKPQDVYIVNSSVVFVRPKCSNQIGQIGLVKGFKPISINGNNRTIDNIFEKVKVLVEISGKIDQKEELLVEPERLIQRFNPTGLGASAASDPGASDSISIIFTYRTDDFRCLASSQLQPDDTVLEIGCSNGCASRDIIKFLALSSRSLSASTSIRKQPIDRVKSHACFIGLDTSSQMIAEAKAKFLSVQKEDIIFSIPSVIFAEVDPFLDPKKAIHLATRRTIDNKERLMYTYPETDLAKVKGEGSEYEKEKDTHQKQQVKSFPNVILIDIGGDRNLKGVVRMISWVRAFLHSPSLRTIIIKSEEMVDNIQNEVSKEFSLNANGQVKNGDMWFNKLGSNNETHSFCSETNFSLPPKYGHPLKAPLTMVPSGSIDENGRERRIVPICRYHNYHKDGCRKKCECQFDHNICHWCLRPGHIALNCPGNIIQ